MTVAAVIVLLILAALAGLASALGKLPAGWSLMLGWAALALTSAASVL